MANSPYFHDDKYIQATLSALCERWLADIRTSLPERRINEDEQMYLRTALRQQMSDLLFNSGHHLIHGPCAFGDPFALHELDLPRQAVGYGLQQLGSDQVLDRNTGNLRSIRTPKLHPVFSSFSEAYTAGKTWVKNNHEISDIQLAIVPLGFDPELERHVLIYGVLQADPSQDFDF